MSMIWHPCSRSRHERLKFRQHDTLKSSPELACAAGAMVPYLLPRYTATNTAGKTIKDTSGRANKNRARGKP